MHTACAPLLEHLRIFHSRNAEETRAFLGGKAYRFDIEREDAANLDARINGVYMSGVYVGYVQYGDAAVALSPGRERSDYWLQLPLNGRLAARVGRERVACDPTRGAIASPAHEACSFRSDPGSARIQVALSGAAVAGQLGALLGEPPPAPVVFVPAIDLAGGPGRSLSRCILMAVADLEQAGSVLWSAATVRAFEQFLVTALLESHRHNYSEALGRPGRSISPRDVKRAVDFIEANLEEAIDLASIVAAAGVPGRTLFQHFRDCRGVAPMQYLRNARFRRVRQALLEADPEEGVTAIALRCGFTHMGRFAVEYRRRFGESPSATLARRRRRD